MKKAFSLIEVVFVIVLVGSLLLLCMLAFSTQFDKLQYKASKEAFLSAYQQVFSKNLSSGIASGVPYTGMLLSFSPAGSGFSVQYVGQEAYQADLTKANSAYSDTHLQILDLFVGEEKMKDALQLSFSPYLFSCLIGGQETRPLVIVALMREERPYCFQISPRMCRMIEIPCDCQRIEEKYQHFFICSPSDA